MNKITNSDQTAINGILKTVEAVIRSFQFKPSSDAPLIYPGSSFLFDYGLIHLEEKIYEQLLEKLGSDYPNIAKSTIETQCDDFFQDYIKAHIVEQQVDWDMPFLLKDQISSLISDEWIRLHIEQLLSNLTGLIRTYDIFVGLQGLELNIPMYDFGPVKLVRTKDGLPATERTQGVADFTYTNQALFNHFAAVPCHIQATVTGDVEFALQEGHRFADQLAAIINLYLANWILPRDPHKQKIQSSGATSFYATVVLARTSLPAEDGSEKPTYLPAASKHGVIAYTLDQTQLNEMQTRGFNELWKCFEQRGGKSNKLCERVRRAVVWFEKAVNFDEPDEQFVGLTTALEILLVSKADLSNPFSTWSSITQQLADRCAFLLGHDLSSTMAISARVKQLYGVRGGVVHEGKEPTVEELRKMVELVSRVIVDFVERKFSSYEAFDTWIKRLTYSVNLDQVNT